MRTITTEELNKINEMNGSKSDRYNYYEALADILNGEHITIRYNTNRVKGVALDKATILDIGCKTVRGKMMIEWMGVNKHTEEEHHWQYFKLKKGTLTLKASF